MKKLVLDFFLKEWLLLVSVAGLLLTSLYLQRLPRVTPEDAQILFILAALFVAVKGVERSGLMLRLSRMLGRGRRLPLKLVLATFVLSMVVTNDVALVVIVPLTMALDARRKDLLVILEALAANAGSALTPFGNPQNLFLYWHYGLQPETFVAAIAPFSFLFLLLFSLLALFIPAAAGGRGPLSEPVRGSAILYAGLLLVVVLTALRLLPAPVAALVLLYALFFDRGSLRIDYLLLVTLICFFGISENVKSLFQTSLEHSGHIFIFSALSSQVISNVPAALMFAKFTGQWQALLWGSNVGGFGSLVGSLANLIAYRIYLSHGGEGAIGFTTRFMLFGYLAFAVGIGLYFLLQGWYL